MRGEPDPPHHHGRVPGNPWASSAMLISSGWLRPSSVRPQYRFQYRSSCSFCRSRTAAVLNRRRLSARIRGRLLPEHSVLPQRLDRKAFQSIFLGRWNWD